MRKRLIAGNWKMNKSPAEAEELAGGIIKQLESITRVDVVLCPPFPALISVYEKIKHTYVKLGAQDLFWEKEGAYTGEVSPMMLRESGCRYVITGHSERRIYFKETDAVVNRKVKAALQWNLVPIVCIGENLEERENNEVENVITRQVKGSFAGLNGEEISKLIIAYEPIWAIGTGKTAAPKQANEVHELIRRLVHDNFTEEAASHVRILYGGSVKPGNIRTLINEKDIDGALVGGASLEGKSFAEIVKGSLP